ncbi:MAG TPA: DUF4352 domain-containing protein [Ktedonobacterales bacterium]|nr:DUF4352 domain-containing protein [Ktedonobacterales bacterium]
MPTTSRTSLRQSLRMMLPLLSLLGVLALVIMACGSSSTNAGTSVGSSSANSSSSSSNSKHFKVGDQVKVGDTYVVTVNSFKTNPGDEISKPKSGNVFVVVDLTIKNVSSEEQSVSSLLQFTLKDSTGQKYNETILSSATPPDGKLAAGDIIKGQIAYEVSASQHDFTFAFEADMLSSGQTIWDLHV